MECELNISELKYINLELKFFNILMFYIVIITHSFKRLEGNTTVARKLVDFSSVIATTHMTSFCPPVNLLHLSRISEISLSQFSVIYHHIQCDPSHQHLHYQLIC
jgi:hypothetical protein